MSHLKEEQPLEKMTVIELKEMAMTIPHEHLDKAIHDMHKDELVAFLKEAKGIKEEEPPKKKKKPHVRVKTKLAKPELKAKIMHLRDAKKAAQKAGDRKISDRLRRRISHLKKKTRKIA